MYDKQQFKDWYEKNKEKQRIWSRNYYQKNKDRIRRVHKIWEQKNMDTGGSIWRKYGRWSRLRNPNINKEYYQKYRERILAQKKIYYRKKKGLMYKPLPESVTIKPSGIHALGLFADQEIKQGTNLGITHIKIDDKIIRTPLGGFINHANEPNCTKVSLYANGNEPRYKRWNLVTIKDIKKGEEITLRYTFYNI